MTDVYIKQTHYTESLPVDPLTINPLTVADVQKVAPIAVHLKELNQVAPLSVESLRVDQVRHVDPLRIDRLNITQLPSVNLSLSQLPALDINVRHVPPVAIALQQRLELTSDYTIDARLLGIPLMRMALQGRTQVMPRDCARREQSRTHEQSFPSVAAAGNPAIPSRAIETSTCMTTRWAAAPPPPQHRYHSHAHPEHRHPLRAGAPAFGYSLGDPPQGGTPDDSAMSVGG